MYRFFRLCSLFVIICVFTNCGNSQEAARLDLGQLNIPFTPESFIDYIQQGDEFVVNLFIKAGMSPDTKNKNGKTALMFAAETGHKSIVETLLKNGALYNEEDIDGNTAIIYAATMGRIEVVRAFSNKVKQNEILAQPLLNKITYELQRNFGQDDNSTIARLLGAAELINPNDPEFIRLSARYYSLLAKQANAFGNLNYGLEFTKEASRRYKKFIDISSKQRIQVSSNEFHSKISLIWGLMAYNYYARGKVDSAAWAFQYGLSEGGFTQKSKQFSKNTMASCAKNALLFTDRDEDASTMWFLQYMEDFRKDIGVISLMLLNNSQYIKTIKNSSLFGTGEILLGYTDDDVDRLSPIGWPQEKLVSIPVKNTHLNGLDRIEWVLKPTLTTNYGNGIRVQDIMLMHIIEQNKWERPVYFIGSIEKVNKIGLDDYLASKGPVLYLMPQKTN